MTTRRDGVSPWPVVLAIAMLLVAMATLWWLRGRLIEGREADLTGAVRRFETTGVLSRPENPAISIEDVERLAIASESDLIRKLHVVKTAADGAEVTIVPFHADLVTPQWRQGPGWIRLPVGDEPAGYLYIQTNNAPLHAVNGAIALMGALLAGGLGVLILRQRRKEEQVNRLQVELEERRVEVIQLERLALAGQLSANIFHDIKKPVLNIKHEVNDAIDGVVSPGDVLKSVQAQTDLFLQMLRDLGMEAFVNPGQENHEWCDLHELAERALRLVRYEQGSIEVEVCFAEGEDYLIEGYSHRFVQLFSNLVLNAFQAMNGSGRLRISGSRTHDRMSIAIEDSGPGIPAPLRGELFQPFMTTRAETGGSGLGLYICKSIVEELGGTIRIEDSEDLGGARFEIELPAASDRAANGRSNQ